ncbi:MAG: NYN domain-containing protein [Candidatus Omnitrophica bacterium]|nr:NYN domain-containing protein [Candidatus Omnitrophota bacterium]
MSRYLIIDGYNAINKIVQLEAKSDVSLETARMSFIQMLKNFMTHKDIFDKIFIVFDSSQNELGVRRHSYGDIEALFIADDKDADSFIVDMLRGADPSDKISVCSDDNFVRNHSKVFGRDVISVSELEEIMLKENSSRSTINIRGLDRDRIGEINEELKKHWRLT